MAKWKGNSACQVLRYLGSKGTPETTARCVIAALGFKVADNTFKIQWRAGKAEPTKGTSLQLTPKDAKHLAGLLTQHGAAGNTEVQATHKERKRLIERYEEPNWHKLGDRQWADELRWKEMQTDAPDALGHLQWDLIQSGFGKDTGFTAKACWEEAVRRLRKKYGHEQRKALRPMLKE